MDAFEVVTDDRDTLPALFWRFLRLGLLAWGGPVAQIGMIKRELVEEERWVDPPRFNRMLAVYQALPGPEAHELCVHLGMLRRGRIGGILAGLGFMLPGFVLVLLLALLYRRMDLSQQPLAAIFLGVQVGVVAIIVRAVHRIGEHALVDRALCWVAALSALAAILQVPFWISLPAGGLAYALWAGNRVPAAVAIAILAVTLAGLLAWFAPGSSAEEAAQPVAGGVLAGALALFLSGLKAGLLTFGGAYTAIPFVRDDAVGQGWVSEGQFLDSVALSGIIPAPLVIFATFVGYLAGGFGGALAMTAGIFLPAFSFALLFSERLERVVEDERLRQFLAGVAAAVVGVIAVTALELGYVLARTAPSLIVAALIFAGSLAALYLYKSKLILPVVVLGAGVAGMMFTAEIP